MTVHSNKQRVVLHPPSLRTLVVPPDSYADHTALATAALLWLIPTGDLAILPIGAARERSDWVDRILRAELTPT